MASSMCQSLAQSAIRAPAGNCAQLHASSGHLVSTPVPLPHRACQRARAATLQCRASWQDMEGIQGMGAFKKAIVPALAAAIIGGGALPLGAISPALAETPSRYEALFEKVKEAEGNLQSGTATIKLPAEENTAEETEVPKALTAAERREKAAAERREAAANLAQQEAERREAERKAEAARAAVAEREAEQRAEAERKAAEAKAAQEKARAQEKERAQKQQEVVKSVKEAAPLGKKRTHGYMPLFLAQLLVLALSAGLITLAFFLPKGVEEGLKKKLASTKAQVEPYVKQAQALVEKARPAVEKVLGTAGSLVEKVKPVVATVAREAKPLAEKAIEASKPLAAKALDATKQAAEEAKKKADEALAEAKK